MAQVEILRVVVASPGDVQTERNILPQIIEELNRGIAAERNVMLALSRWETDAYPGFHAEGPQGLIDPILDIEDCDVFIGIFWKRFGTPVSGSRSGTEHEFKRAVKAWKKDGRPQIMFYFNQRPFRPQSAEEVEQMGRVLEFQRNFPKEGLWWTYKSKAEFEKLVRNHLTNFIRNEGIGEEGGGDQSLQLVRRHGETTVLRGEEYDPHNYRLTEGNVIVINMSSDEVIDVLIMDKRDFNRWDGDDEVPSYYEFYEDKMSLNTSFFVPKNNEYYVVFWNRSEEDEATVELEIEIWG